MSPAPSPNEGVPPDGNTLRYRVRLPNRPLTIFRGRLFLDTGDGTVELDGRISLGWSPGPQVCFRGDPVAGTLALPIQRTRLRIPTLHGLCDAFVRSWSATRFTGETRGPLMLGKSRAVRTVRFHLPNFHSYAGGVPIRVIEDGVPVVRPYRITLRHRQWVVHIDQTAEVSETYAALRWYGGYGITHVGVIERHDQEVFSLPDVEEFLVCLSCFLTFVRGLWCSPVIIEGLDGDAVLWTQWQGDTFATGWRDVQSWFPVDDAAVLQQAFPGFCDLWDQRDKWRQVLGESLYWYTEANLNAGAIEGGIVLAHATLERLAWTDLGERDGKNRRFLNKRGIPAHIPDGLPALGAWARETGSRDGLHAVSYLRDKLVHPDPKGRRVLARATSEVRVQARDLALWYIELALLSLCGYQGSYTRRVVPPGTNRREATGPVPWRGDQS